MAKDNRRSPARIAAEVRQLFRALEAQDQDALDFGWLHFENLLVNVLTAFLKEDPRWDPELPRRANRYDGWWIDFLCESKRFVVLPTKLRILSDALWYNDANLPDPSPFKFDLELCADTGAARWYALYFGDAKVFGHQNVVTQDDAMSTEWAFAFQWGTRQAAGLQKHWRAVPLTNWPRMDRIDFHANGELWLAALARQIARANNACDKTALAVTMLYWRFCLRKTLERFLRQDTRWRKPGENIGRALIDGLKGSPLKELAENFFVLCDEVILSDPVRRQSYTAPIELELELDRDGSFVELVIRFGRDANGAWEFFFRRTRQDASE